MLLFKSLLAQCPDRDLLYRRIETLKKDASIPYKSQLTELTDSLRKTADCTEINDSVIMTLYRRIGALNNLLSNYTEAILFTKKAITIGKAGLLTGKTKEQQLVPLYYNLSYYFNELELNKERQDAMDTCIRICLKTKSGFSLIKNYLLKRVEYLFGTGDYKRCFDFSELCENIIVENPDKDSLAFASKFFTWKINALLEEKNYSLIRLLLLEKIEECKKKNKSNFISELYPLLAQWELTQGNTASALELFQKAQALCKKTSYNLGCAQALNNIGFYIYHDQNPAKAKSFYLDALKYCQIELAKDSPSNPQTVRYEALNISGNLATNALKQNNFDAALGFFQKGFDYLQPGLNESSLLELRATTFSDAINNRYIVSFIIDKGDAYLKKYYSSHEKVSLVEALHVYQAADKLLDKINSIQSEIESKLDWRRDAKRLYEHAVEAAYLAGQNQTAFYFFEKNRGVLLREQLIKQQSLNQNDLLHTAQLKQAIQRLRWEMDTLSKSSPQYIALQKEMYSLQQDQDLLNAKIQSNNPLYFKSFYDSSHVTLEGIQKYILQDYSGLVELFSGDSAVYSLIITHHESKLNKIPKKIFDSLASAFIFFTSQLNVLNRNYSKFIDISHQLYKLLFNDETNVSGRIIISPDGKYFPFEALVTDISSPKPVYFLERNAVSYTYSANYLLSTFQNTNANGNFLGMAPVNYLSNPDLPVLTGSDQSLSRIGSYFGNADELVKEKANRNAFIQSYPEYSVIQLYTHASDSSSRNEPVIWFSDSALYLSELINEIKPITRLIVLSACETGQGQIYQGEGVFSFNRAFATIGIPAAITNLWKVDSKSTYEITELFYKYLAEGFPTDIALQKAKLTFIQTGDKGNSLPYYWAAPVLVGNAEIIPFGKTSWKVWIITGSILLAIFGFWFFRNRQHQKLPHSKKK